MACIPTELILSKGPCLAASAAKTHPLEIKLSWWIQTRSKNSKSSGDRSSTACPHFPVSPSENPKLWLKEATPKEESGRRLREKPPPAQRGSGFRSRESHPVSAGAGTRSSDFCQTTTPAGHPLELHKRHKCLYFECKRIYRFLLLTHSMDLCIDK